VTGGRYTLSSEAEWEKGARGADGRISPWGHRRESSRCNSDESGVRKTTAVHTYPQGASPYGVLDMEGNVWEWTRSLEEYRYPYKLDDGRENPEAARDVSGGCGAGRTSMSSGTAVRPSLRVSSGRPGRGHRVSGGGAPMPLSSTEGPHG
jgi:formylglycine-generating enzyme required for sulfatase activity